MFNTVFNPGFVSQLPADSTPNSVSTSAFSGTFKQPATLFSTRSLLLAPCQGLLIPMGGGYDEVLPGFGQVLFARVRDTNVCVTIVPASFSSSAFAISPAERAQHLACAERRRQMIELALNAAAPSGVTCNVALAPIFVRDDAEDESNLAYFGPEVDAVFLLGGDQAVAMRVLHGTPAEAAIDAIYRRGGIIGGTSAGAGMQAQIMLAGFRPGYGMQRSLHIGATAVWNTGEERGLICGAGGIIFDQHFFQRGRMGRLLEAITSPGAPGIGVGIDAYTGLQVRADGHMGDVFGAYSVAVLDAQSYGAVDNASQRGSHGSISLRNVLVHLLAPGGSSYDLRTCSHSLAPNLPLPQARRFDGLALPQGAGTLYLSGGMDDGKRAEFAAGATIALSARDPQEIDCQKLAVAREAWLHGAPLWLEGAYAAAAGAYYCAAAAPQTTRDPEDLSAQEAAEIAARRALVTENVELRDGLGLLAANFEPRVVENGAWGRLFALAYEHAEQPAFGLGANTALVITEVGAEVIGEEAVIALDLRMAARDLGDNGAYVVANGLLDVFVPGEAAAPHAAGGLTRLGYLSQS